MIPLADLETADPGLLTAKATKTIVDYSFTLKPCLVRYLLATVPKGEFLTYLDSDLYFYADPEPLFEELRAGSVGIIPHRFPKELDYMKMYGIYNAGWVSFRNDDQGHACNDWWRERCLEWCYDRLEGDYYADQSYLDGLPSRFVGTVVIQHLGANVAPWNVGQYEITAASSSVSINRHELIFYHFHALRGITGHLFDGQLSKYGVDVTDELRHLIYKPYLNELYEMDRMVRSPAPANSQLSTEPGASASGFDLVPRGSGPHSEASIEQAEVESYLYRKLVLAERESCARLAVILELKKTCEEREALIKKLDELCHEREAVIKKLKESCRERKAAIKEMEESLSFRISRRARKIKSIICGQSPKRL